MKELDYELRVQGLVQMQNSGSALLLHHAAAKGRLEDVRYLVEKKHYNPLQRDQCGIAPFHMAAIVGNVQVFKYCVTECNCNPACPGPLGLTPLHLASELGHLDIVKYLVDIQQIDPLCEDEYGNILCCTEFVLVAVRQLLSFLLQDFRSTLPSQNS